MFSSSPGICWRKPGGAGRLIAILVVMAAASPLLVSSPAHARKRNAPLLSTASPTPANCLQDEFTAAGNNQKLNCTANDVKVAKVINIRNLDGSAKTTCNSGETISFIADFLVQTTSSSSRSNIGLYFGTGGASQTTALTGTCSDNIIPPKHTCAGSAVDCGSSSYNELDTTISGDNCGDTSSTDPTVCLDATNMVVDCSSPSAILTFPSTQVVTIEIDGFNCSAPAGTNQLVLPNCTSWQIPGKVTKCSASEPNYPYPLDINGKPEAIPGSPSKCNCDSIPLGITVQSPVATVAKSCNTNDQPTGTNTSCTLSPEGGTVTYTVAITNNSNFGDIIVDQICDSAYGTVFRANSFTGSTCSAGSKGSIAGTNCSALDIAKGSPQSCTFTADQPENTTVDNIVAVSGHGESTGSFGPTDSNEVTVVSGEATTTATLTKTLSSTTDACTTVRYQVDVKNTSAAGTDETVTLSSLTDDHFGDITKYTGTGNANVLGTTCGVDAGVGTLAGTAGAGTLPHTPLALNAHYICQFDAEFCGPVTTITPTANSSCTGISHTNHVTANLTGDEGEVVSYTYTTLTVYQCLSSSTSSF
jgi:hypothetical protein